MMECSLSPPSSLAAVGEEEQVKSDQDRHEILIDIATLGMTSLRIS
jgi:hypothetical protein